MDMYFWVFPVAKKKRKKESVKNEKKWCRNLLGYCPTVSQYNGKFYCDTEGLGSVVWLEDCVTIQWQLYRDMVAIRGSLGVECHDTKFVS